MRDLGTVAGIVQHVAGDAEVGEHHPAVIAEVDIRGFDVRVHDPDPMGCLQHTEQAKTDVRHPREGEWASDGNHIRECAPEEWLHDDPALAVVVHDVVDRHGFPVVDLGGGARLVQQTVGGS